MGIGDVVEIADTAAAHRGSMSDAHRASMSGPIITRARAETMSHADAPAPLAAIAADRWRELTERAIEPNGYYLPEWEWAVSASARGRTDVSALSAWSDAEPGLTQLIGLLPAISLWRACKTPLPALVSADPYGTLGTPLLDREMARDAVIGMMRQARDAGAHALILRDVTFDGAAMKTFTEVLGEGGVAPCVLQSHARACLDARRDADELLRDALGAKKLKELRRQRNRLAEHGEVSFDVARTPGEVAGALEIFMALEASRWKARRRTPLIQDECHAPLLHPATLAPAVTNH